MNIFENPIAQNKKTQDGALKKATTLNTSQEIFEAYLLRENRIHEEEFEELWKEDPVAYANYAPRIIAKEKTDIEAMKRSDKYEKPENFAIVLENIFGDVLTRGKFLGDMPFKAIQLSEYDDKHMNGAHCDVVLEMQTEAGLLHLGIDLTTASHPDSLNKKRDKCISGVKSGNFATVKYFKSEFADYMGELDRIPVVIAGFDKDTVLDLCGAIGRNDDLSKHHAQFIVLEEIIHELGRLSAIAQLGSRDKDTAVATLEYYKEIFVGIAEKKKNLRTVETNAKVRTDKAYKFLTAYF
ncbi:MAG TPA: hypothetical protein VF817_01340 [Patescibacteria group bacterium]